MLLMCGLQARPQHGMTKRSYVDAVLAGMKQYHCQHPDDNILVKLLLSIDRREDTAAALDTVRHMHTQQSVVAVLYPDIGTHN